MRYQSVVDSIGDEARQGDTAKQYVTLKTITWNNEQALPAKTLLQLHDADIVTTGNAYRFLLNHGSYLYIFIIVLLRIFRILQSYHMLIPTIAPRL